MLTKLLKYFVPPIVKKIIYYDYRYGWHGNYSSWEEANAKCSGYADPSILEKVKSAALKVKNGEANFERASVLYDKTPYSLPVIATLLWTAVCNNNQLTIADIGGALATGYYQHKRFLTHLSKIEWCIIEQPHFVACGREHFENAELKFYNSLADCFQQHTPVLAMCSTSLQYFKNPYEVLQEIINRLFDFLLLDRITFSANDSDRLTIQRAHPRFYVATYPCWFFSKAKLLNFLSPFYELINEYDCYEAYPLGLDTFSYKGLLFKRK